MLEGRGFTLKTLKKSIIACCKSSLSSFYINCWDLDLWELIEAIELVTELAEEKQPNQEVDIFEALGVG